MVNPSPFVYWAQDARNIFLKVDLKDIKGENIKLGTNEISVSAQGIGAHGSTQYSFSLNFYDDIDVDDEVNQIKATPRAFQFTLKKVKPNWWPRLIKHQQKPAWLKVDFERWQSEDDDLSDTNELSGVKDVIGDYPELFEKLNKDEFGYVKEDAKKVYLVLYNLAQFVFFTYFLVVMGIRFMRNNTDCLQSTYEAIGPALKFSQILQWLEVMHPMFGYTSGGVLLPSLQMAGRSFMLFAMIDAEPRMQTKPVVAYLILVWCILDFVKYPYMISELYKKNVSFLTWIYYTIWIPLYPLAALFEGIIILRNIPYFEETQRFVVSMPNSWNSTFHMPTAMRLYLLLLFLPEFWNSMIFMHRSRRKKLGLRRWKSKSD